MKKKKRKKKERNVMNKYHHEMCPDNFREKKNGDDKTIFIGVVNNKI